MDIIDIAMELVDLGTSSDLEASLGFLGQYGIIEIKLFMRPLVIILTRSGFLQKNIYMSSKVQQIGACKAQLRLKENGLLRLGVPLRSM